MPVEIRELLIHTEIKSQEKTRASEISHKERKALKQEIVQECTRKLRKQFKNPSLER